MKTEHKKEGPKKLPPAEAAAQNGGVLKRGGDGAWMGAHPVQRFSAEEIATMVQDGRATYTQFRPGTKGATEVRFDLVAIYSNYQMS